MSFFDPPPPPPELDDEYDDEEQGPYGPPRRLLGGVVAAHLLLARTEDLFIAASHITVYPEGLAFRLSGAFRRRPPRRFGDCGLPGEADPDGLRVGVLYPDGRKAQSGAAFWWDPDERDADRPVLMPGGGGSGGTSWHEDHWLWPAPPAGHLVFVVAWPACDLPETRQTLDAALLADARTRIVEIWPA